MSEVYTALSLEERRRAAANFLEFLRQRDGTPEPLARKLSKREEYFQGIERHQVRSRRGLDTAKFKRNHLTREIEPNLDAAMLWLLCTAKLNRGERYGVDMVMAYKVRKGNFDPNLPETFLQIEEFYHTRMLLDVLKVFGLEIEVLPPNSRITRLVIQAMVYLPQRFSTPFSLAGEILGVAFFYLMREKAKEIFADEPEVLERILSLFNEIMVDEIGHVFFARARAGKIGLWFAKRMQNAVLNSVVTDLPELVLLFGKEKLVASVANVAQILNGNEEWPIQPFRYQSTAPALVSSL